jgi:hypothetical protein
MMVRIAALLLIASQLLLLWLTLAPSGKTSILFMFVGHPLVLVGSVLGVVALTRRKARERSIAEAERPPF